MALPEQVRKQSEAIDKLYKDLNADEAADAQQTGEGEGVQAGEADSGANQTARQHPDEHGGDESKGQQTAEQRYRTLQGMYNADTGRLRAENQQLHNRLSQIEQLMATMAQAPAPQSMADQKFVTEQDIEEYGDSVDLMRRVTREETHAHQREIAELKDVIRRLQASVVPRVEQVAQAQAHSTEQSFWSTLNAMVPDWRDVNSDPGFHEWLLEVDPLSGLARQTFLDNAQRSFDVQRVAQFFNAWKGSAGNQVAQTQRGASKSELERQVVPGKGRAGAAPTSSGQDKTYTPADIAKFYTDVRQGRFKGKDDERARLERDIFAAQREGRIVANG
jgi:hypothetical protein